MVDGNSVHVQGFAPQFTEVVEEDRRDEPWLTELPGDQLEQLVRPLLDELAGQLLVDRVLADDAAHGDVGPFREMLADALQAFPRNADRRHVRLRIHARLPGQGAAVRARPVRSRLSSLRGDALDRGLGSWDHLLDRGLGFRPLFGDEDEGILPPRSKGLADGIDFGRDDAVCGQVIRVEDSSDACYACMPRELTAPAPLDDTRA